MKPQLSPLFRASRGGAVGCDGALRAIECVGESFLRCGDPLRPERRERQRCTGCSGQLQHPVGAFAGGGDLHSFFRKQYRELPSVVHRPLHE